MATSDTVTSIHDEISLFMSTGLIAYLLGMSTYLGGYEYQDFDRVTGINQEHVFQTRKKVAFAIFIISAFIYISGIVLMALGISLYRTEREDLADSITGIIRQTTQNASQPDINEPAILAGIAAAMILLGSAEMIRHFHKSEQWGWIGYSIFSAGWLLNAFAAAMNNMSINSLRTDRLMFSLPGAVAVAAGTAVFPWALHHNYISSASFPLVAIGLGLFSVSTSYVVKSPD